jgi:transcription antitermination factor NusG
VEVAVESGVELVVLEARQSEEQVAQQLADSVHHQQIEDLAVEVLLTLTVAVGVVVVE